MNCSAFFETQLSRTTRSSENITEFHAVPYFHYLQLINIHMFFSSKLGWNPSKFDFKSCKMIARSSPRSWRGLEALKPLICLSYFSKVVSTNPFKNKNTYSVMSDFDDILPGVSSEPDAGFPAFSAIKAYVLRSFWFKTKFWFKSKFCKKKRK